MNRLVRFAPALLALVLAAPVRAAQGLGNLVSPGALAKPHAKLEGLDKCQSCHEPGRQVTAARCLECHKPVAERIKAKKGVHRAVAGDCSGCHVEHAGVDGDLRHFTTKGFDHKGETGFALDGLHAPLDCKACHKARTFLGLSQPCASCHKDVHNGTLGATCQTCHPTNVAFKDTRKTFDHAKTKYPLTGAHSKTPCESCHKTKGNYRIARFGACEDCHRNPHTPSLGTCTACHVTASFKTLAEGKKFDHTKTGYPLKGKHAAVVCQACHVKPAALVTLKFTRCADCHQDVHKGVFPADDCAACHTEAGFRPAKFDHTARTKFRLDGKHATATCVACHKQAGAPARAGTPPAQRTVEFRGAKAACASCHADVHKGKLAATCQTCHGTTTFKLGTFQHPSRPEFFRGAHAGVACEKCHTPEAAAPSGAPVKGAAAPAASRRYKGVPFDCAACHKDPHLGQVGADCAKCHGLATKGYKADVFAHTASKFPLTGKHETVPCAKCHAKETGTFPAGKGTAVRLTGIGTDCKTCHKDPHLGQVSPRCETCHSTSTFRIEKFAHPKKKETEGFFVAKHAAIACAECHRKETMDFPSGRGTAVRYAVPVACTHCHEDVHHGALGRDCASCHNASIWRTASRAFHKTAAFTLEGKHLSVPCASCHVKGVLKGTPTGCYDCHWIRRQDDRFKTNLGGDCQTCHRPIAWTAVTWSHAAATGFTLETPHKTLDCESCHKNQVFKGTPRDCYSCHRADYEKAQNPAHVAGGFPTDCTGCHKPSSPTWQGATFTHASFLLAGVHLTQACAACHRNNVFKGTPRDCYTCHKTDYQNSKSPPHASAAFPVACETCHKYSAPNWRDAGFNHNVTTTFALGGVHITQPCAACHVNNVFKGTPRDCFTCHKTDYQNSKSPPHAAAAFATTCDSCHKYTDPAWKPATFNHSTATTFALAGVHATQACATCHVNNVFKGTPRDCFACHKTDYQNSKTPSHAAAGFPTACDTCHKFADAAWKPSTFNHSTSTTFPLAGTHATQLCSACHKNNVFKGTARDCWSCHKTDFQNSVNPGHVEAGFPTTCDGCHRFSDAAWKPAAFNHSTSTTFPLVGVHATSPCAKCHVNNVFKGTARDCYTCHRSDFTGATTPVPHTGFVTTCDTCHKNTDSTWSQKSAFNHSAYFPLAGAHVTAPCAQCHKSGNYLTVATSPCSACHMNDYNTAKSPVNHTASLFPTTCDSCHKFADPTWFGATFSHTTFPLVGAHATTACATCHNPPYAPSANNYTTVPTSCYGCHVKDFNGATTPVPHTGFVTTCDTCHKNTDATWSQKSAFNHSAYFPLAGAHVTAPCAQCHVNNNYLTVATSPCSVCHMNDYNAAKAPVNHVASLFPTTCDSCHKFSDASWFGATFSHTTFPLVGVHATTPCATCHNPPYAPSANNYTTVPTSCYGCHVRDFNGATTPVPHTGFVTTCDTCHRNTDATWSQKSAFNHSAYFPLAGAHVTAPCAQCHVNNNYLTVATSPCSACHMNDYNTAKSPVDHVASLFPTTCDSCHKFSDATWMQATFSHTTFPLVGVHATTPCATCHNPPYAPSANNYTTVPTSCYGCHVRDFNGATTPVPHTGFATTCDTCHRNTDATWSQKSAFNHSAYFPLAGAHVTAPCAQCHVNNNYLTVATSPCSACHMNDYNTAKSPVDHVASLFPTTCDSCHKFSDATWMQATFSHTTFPLVGVHATTPCATCHNPPYAPSANNYTTVPTSCYGCHVRDFNGATTPVPHTGFVTTCDTCHRNTDATWSQKSAFNHSAYFPLAGAHVTAPCAQCHVNNNYLTVATSPCSACHMNDYNTAKSPVDHVASLFPTTCDSCHKFSDATWMQATFSHTTFPLVGVHATTPCATCHNPPYAPSANNYTTVPTSCYGCHVRDFNGATTPVPHTGFVTTCDTCHRNTDATWSQKSAFNHSAYFPLVGSHLTASCAKCHNPPYAPSANNYTAVPTTCIGCHQTDFNTATTPVPHTGFVTTCDSCHRNTDTTWSQKSAFNHSAYFALAGAHLTAPCSQCHNPPYAPSANNYLTVPTSPCVACHQADYNTARSPVDHIAAAFPTTCDACHKFTDATWLVATFTHSTFPLVGIHATTACAVCHNPPYAPSTNNYTAVPTSCYGCHVRDFNGATSPVPHAGFPTTCDSCHRNTDTTWSQKSAFSHTSYFPLTSNHNVPCNQCHTTATSYLVYNCIGCHTQSQTNGHHTGVRGYVWASTACYSCHPNGRAG